MRTRTNEFDVVVVGAGPGGATAATCIAMQGHRVLLLERDRLPIYKIGESLLPSTIHGVCAMLGVSEDLKAANFMQKLGGTFRWGRAQEPWTFRFSASSEFPGPASYAYQVERMKFDSILVNNARRKGVEVREQHGVTEAVVEGDRVVGVRVVNQQGEQTIIGAKFVVDASGHSSTLVRHVGERIYSKVFRNLAVFGYFLNGKRLPAPASGNIFCAAFDKGWIWYIPLSDELTSVGAVIGTEHAPILQIGKEPALMEFIASCEPMREMLRDGVRVREGVYGEVRVRKDFSYCNTTFWRPGLALVGDAACFIDPVFSTGVHLATYSGLLAARSINSCLANQIDEQTAFKEFERRYLREYSNFHQFLLAFYDVQQDLDSYYWAARKVLSLPQHGNEAFIRLVGGVGGWGEQLQSNDLQGGVAGLGEQLFPAAQGEGDMVQAIGLQGNVASASMRDQFMGTLLSETVQMQMQARKIQYSHSPLFEGGLIPSDDGFHWARASA